MKHVNRVTATGCVFDFYRIEVPVALGLDFGGSSEENEAGKKVGQRGHTQLG